MARKKRHPEHENHERWLISYADFITLLFAFFVVMFATSQTDKGKTQQMEDSMRKAIEGDPVVSRIASILGGTPDDKGQGNAQWKGPGGAEKTAGDVTTKFAELAHPTASEQTARAGDRRRQNASLHAVARIDH